MLTYTGQRNLYGKLTGNESTANLSLGDSLIDIETRRLVRKLSGNLLIRTRTDTTFASQQAYVLPLHKKLRAVTITSGTTKWQPKECPTEAYWNKLNETTYTSDVAEWYRILNGSIYFYPTPSSSGNTITYTYDIMQRTLSVADYTTGTISAIANGATTVTGGSTVWTSAMAGRYIKIDEPTGDGQWYEIASVASTTSLTLTKKYEGTTIAAGSGTYTIGQVSVLPDGYHEQPVFRATQIYYSKIDQNRAAYFKDLADTLEKDLIADHGNVTSNVVIEDTDIEQTNPNLMITL